MGKSLKVLQQYEFDDLRNYLIGGYAMFQDSPEYCQIFDIRGRDVGTATVLVVRDNQEVLLPLQKLRLVKPQTGIIPYVLDGRHSVFYLERKVRRQWRLIATGESFTVKSVKIPKVQPLPIGMDFEGALQAATKPVYLNKDKACSFVFLGKSPAVALSLSFWVTFDPFSEDLVLMYGREEQVGTFEKKEETYAPVLFKDKEYLAEILAKEVISE